MALSDYNSILKKKKKKKKKCGWNKKQTRDYHFICRPHSQDQQTMDEPLTPDHWTGKTKNYSWLPLA